MEGIPGQSLSVETLDYPLEWIQPIIETFDLAVCLDMGHLLAHRVDWQAEYCKWAHRINMVHLHGIQNHHDHHCLNTLSQPVFTGILTTLKSFTGTISIEVFSFDNLKRSLAYFEKHWNEQG
jgi:sugar phosphate isomerase/epimerase